MTNKQYKNIIQMTLLNKENTTGKEDVEVLKKIFDNCGVPFPTGTKEEARTALKSGTYVGWLPCSAAEAQVAANEGIPSIGISNEKAYVVEPEVTEALSTSTEINSVYSVDTATLSDEERDSTEYFAQAKFEYDADGNISVMATGVTTEIFSNSWRIDSSVHDQAVGKMNNYYNTNQKLRTHINNGGTCVFAFEGLGSGYGEISTTHPLGFLNAMMIITKGKNITYVTRRASTLPDNRPTPTKHTVLTSGIYSYIVGDHNLYIPDNKYIALVPNANNWTGWYERLDESTNEHSGFEVKHCDGINLHANQSHILSNNSGFSEGCQTVYYDDYVAFGKAVGFLDKNKTYTTNKIVEHSLSAYMHDLVKTKADNDMVTFPTEIKYVLDRTYDAQNSFYANELDNFTEGTTEYQNYFNQYKDFLTGIFYPLQ